MIEEKMKQVVLVEDDHGHAELIRRAFARCSQNIDLIIKHSLKEAQQYVKDNPPDLMITDLILPDGIGIDLLPLDKDEALFPMVVMTSHGDEQVAVEAIKSGALDYVVKSETTMTDMPAIVENVFREWDQFISKRFDAEELELTNKQLYFSEQAMREREGRLRAIFEGSFLGMVLIDLNGHVLECNQAFVDLTGYDRGEIKMKNYIDFVSSEARDKTLATIKSMVEGQQDHCQNKISYVTKDQSALMVRETSSLVRAEDGRLNYIIKIVDAITEE